MLDFVSVVMVLVVLVLGYSIFQVRIKKNRLLHRKMQVATAIVLAIAIVAFEIDVRFLTDWRKLAEPSPYYASGWVQKALVLHLCFAIPTPLVWVTVIVLALRRFRAGFEQSNYNRIHRISGRIAAALMLGTAVTGWFFYYVAFVA